MKLHTGSLYWPQVTNVKKIKSKNIIDANKNDVLIVGGGISGAISAYRLSKAGFKVTLIEKNKIAMGSSAASTGLIQYMSDKGVVYYIETLGYEQGKRFYDLSMRAIQTLLDLDNEIDNLDQDTFLVKESLILATEKNKLEPVKKESEKQDELGYGAKFYDREMLKKQGIDAYGGLCAYPDIALNPYGFVYRLISTAIEKYGLHVMENTEFIDIKDYQSINENQDDLYQLVRIKNQEKIIECKFKKILFATGYNPPEIFNDKLNNLNINKTYVAVSEKNINLEKSTDYLLWEVKEPYTYFRHTFEGSLMTGGLDEEDSNIKNGDEKKNTNKLVRLTKEMLIDKDLQVNIQYQYAALFGESKDNLPYMGIDPDNKNIMVICGAGGNGTVYSTIGSDICLDWVKGENIDEYKMFSLAR